MHRSNQHRYSITSSASANSVGGYGDAKRFRGLQIDHQREFACRHDRKITRLGAIQTCQPAISGD